MTLPVFVVDARALSADYIEVSADEGRHAVVVRRIRAGERILLTDGCGHGAECVVLSTGKGTLLAEVVERLDEPAPAPCLVVVQAVIKADSGEQAVDLMTQVGVDAIVPWAAARSVARWHGERGDREDKALLRWRAAAREAGKQARRLRFPDIRPVQTTDQVAALLGAADTAVVLHQSAEAPIIGVAVPAGNLIALVVGPEGGATDEELTAFAAAGAQAVRLGPSVLRASAAGAVGAAILLSRSRRWG